MPDPDEEEFDSAPKDAVERPMSREEKLAKFFESDRFDELLAIIRKHNRIDLEDFSYKTEEMPTDISADDFRDVFDAVYQEISERRHIREEGPIEKYHIDYRGVRFYLMIGQGSACWTTKLD